MAFFIDTEFSGPRLLSVAVVDDAGEVVYDSLVRPEDIQFDVTWAISAKVHKIYPRDVYRAPPAKQVREEILRLCAGQLVVAYASGAEKSKLPGLADVAQVVCAAQAYKQFKGYTRIVKLGVAIEEAGIVWDFGEAHGALADAQACRALWHYLNEQKLAQALQQLSRPAAPKAAQAVQPRAFQRADRTELSERQARVDPEESDSEQAPAARPTRVQPAGSFACAAPARPPSKAPARPDSPSRPAQPGREAWRSQLA
jgi:DNA polymerase III epsilon subunit-like protein